MSVFNKSDIVILFLSLALMLGLAKIIGELFSRMKLPTVIGEILAGIILGPTILGRLFPGTNNIFFPAGNLTIFKSKSYNEFIAAIKPVYAKQK